MDLENLIIAINNTLLNIPVEEGNTLFEDWYMQSECHRGIYDRLNDRQALKDEYERQENINVERALQDMIIRTR